MCAISLFIHVQIFSHPMGCSPPVSSVLGILCAGIMEWMSFSPPGDLPDPGIEPKSPASTALAGRFFTTSATLIL